ncbi:PAS domain S-box protein [Blastopirellula sp. JC732]|uniref:Sensor protein FixL n=2 Tax=Blastopirellula sediminis TaxID=2894196 RepID=A0A9X1MMC2_9BACT|nr:PAS domain S-box protein [Blastopirellula sediminis]MCC9608328.1 PAS domain S-box protein [Blastopirellula sediminis]MCC9628895.1 PAS domain S-box protein [Blastopirellula sediminis]
MKLSILLIDNDDTHCARLRTFLAKLRYQVDVAHDCPTALQLLQRTPYDVALLDLKIPDMDGIELFRRIKSLRSDTAVIVTSYAASDTAETAIGAGAMAVLPKPPNFPRLIHLVDEALEQPLLVVIDDDPDLCESLRYQFERRGYPVRAVHSLAELQAIFTEGDDFKLALVDFRLQDYGGEEFSRIIREAAPAARTIVITEHQSEFDHIVDKLMSEGAYDYLLKPINADVLRISLQRIAHLNETKYSLKREADARELAEQQHRLLAEAIAHLGEGVIITSDEFDGPCPRIVFVNDAICRITGYAAEELIGKTPKIFQGKRTDIALMLDCQAAVRAERPFQGEFVYYRKDRTAYDAEIVVTPMFDAEGSCTNYVIVQRDITEKNRAARELRDREARLRAILDTATDAIVTIDCQGIIHATNPATSRMFGYADQEMIGRNVMILMPEPYRSEHHGYLARYMETGEAHIIGTGREVVARRKDGTTFPVHLAVSRIENPPLFTGIIRDISALKELQKQVLEIATEEDRRIGQELHDSVQQQLTGLGLLSQTVYEMMLTVEVEKSECQTFADKVAHLAGRVAAGINDVAREVHNLSRGLVPVEIDAEGLRSALRELAARIREQFGVLCECRFQGDTAVTNNFVATHLFRIIQEAVTNAIKHGEAKRIDISLRGSDQAITMEILDDGRGIDPLEVSNLGTGLKIMQYRSGLIGGVFKIAPGPSGGTLVSCIVSRQGSFGDVGEDELPI